MTLGPLSRFDRGPDREARRVLPAAERAETWAALLSGGLGPLEISVERWLDRLEEAR